MLGMLAINKTFVIFTILNVLQCTDGSDPA